MHLTEKIETINDSLVNLFGRDHTTGQAMWRVVWSEDQFEKRLMDVTDEGLQLLTPIAREVPKYRQWIHERYVLERLVLVPEQNRHELGDIKVSYEPIWVFEMQDGTYLPPNIRAAKFVVDTVYAAQGKKSMRKYVDDEAKAPEEHREQRINGLIGELFGNETDTGDALAHGEGISLSGPKFDSAHESGDKK